MSTNPLIRLGELGQSIWLDYITRDLMASGELQRLIDEDGLKGMTSNPTIFEKAISGSNDYDADIHRLQNAGRTSDQIFEALAVSDVQKACDIFRPVYDESNGLHGLVSIEVSPTLADDTDGTIAEAARLWESVDRPNVMIKIPGTKAGLPAITRSLADGININITLLFAITRYEYVIEAFFKGLEERLSHGQPVDRIRSVASFFVSRVDKIVDPELDRLGDPKHIRGEIAVANACAAYDVFRRSIAGKRWRKLADAGAHVQRPLWASTSTKDPAYSDVKYVEALIAPDTVNTLPPDTLEAYRDHGNPEVRIEAGIMAAPTSLHALTARGIDLGRMTEMLEREGVQSFERSYLGVLTTIEKKAGELANR